MGKGSNRRQFNKKLETAFKKRYGLAYRSKTSMATSSPSSDPSELRIVYVMKDGALVPKESRCSGLS